MTSPLAFVLLLQLVLVFAAVEQILWVDGTPQFTTTTPTYPRGGIKAKLIHRDDYFRDKNDASTPREKVDRAARRSLLRVQYLERKRQLAGTTPSSPSPAPGSADWETPLSDGATAEYLMEIDLGTPPQKFVAIADTGSDLTWLNCAPCQSGCASGTTFQPTKSSTYAPLACSSSMCRFLNESGKLEGTVCPLSNDVPASGCSYSYSYGDGSVTRGTLAQETLTMQIVAGGSQTVPDYWFGCSTNAASNSSLLDSSDGLVGLGRGNISFPAQLGKDFGQKFGYCLVSRSSSQVQASPLFFGKDAVPSNAILQFTPLLSSKMISTFYYVGCTGISLNGITVKNISASAFAISPDGSGGFIVDSGTTYTILAESIFTPFMAALAAQTSSQYQPFLDSTGSLLCYVVISWSDWVKDYGKGAPSISFQLTNTTGFTLAVENAWIEMSDTTVCSTILGTSGKMSILGNLQQVGFRVLYDLENQQIGFVKADCMSNAFVISNSQKTVVSMGTTLLSALLSMVALVFTLT